jgi:hypothetical protein
VAGACCAHGFPLEQCFISMPTPEQFAFYDTILNDVILQERTIMDLYLDINCQYRPHWRRVTPAGIQQQQQQQQQQQHPMRFLIPEMHAKSHGQACYQANSSMYHPNAGRPVGEQMEQLWALCRPFNTTRYMAAYNRLDFLDDALGHITSVKAQGFPEQLQASHKHTLQKRGEAEDMLCLVAGVQCTCTCVGAVCWCCVLVPATCMLLHYIFRIAPCCTGAQAPLRATLHEHALLTWARLVLAHLMMTYTVYMYCSHCIR